MDRPLHPACAAWPAMSDSAFSELVASIRVRGLLYPIMLCEGQILDGKERARACSEAGVEPRYETYTGDDPVGFSLDANKHRRHLPVHELTLIGEELSRIKRGGDRGNQHTVGKALPRALPTEEQTQAEIANKLGVSRTGIQAARRLRLNAEPNIIEMARAGKVGIQSAAVYAYQTPREQQRTADIATVRRIGSLQRHHKDRPGKAAKSEQMITIPYSDVINELRPLIKRVKEQSKRHPGTVSLTELSIVAQLLERLIEKWMKSEAESQTHSASSSFNERPKEREA